MFNYEEAYKLTESTPYMGGELLHCMNYLLEMRRADTLEQFDKDFVLELVSLYIENCITIKHKLTNKHRNSSTVCSDNITLRGANCSTYGGI